jgi:hypothetical protein
VDKKNQYCIQKALVRDAYLVDNVCVKLAKFLSEQRDNRNRFGKILFATYADDLTFMVKERIGVNKKKEKLDKQESKKRR